MMKSHESKRNAQQWLTTLYQQLLTPFVYFISRSHPLLIIASFVFLALLVVRSPKNGIANTISIAISIPSPNFSISQNDSTSKNPSKAFHSLNISYSSNHSYSSNSTESNSSKPSLLSLSNSDVSKSSNSNLSRSSNSNSSNLNLSRSSNSHVSGPSNSNSSSSNLTRSSNSDVSQSSNSNSSSSDISRSSNLDVSKSSNSNSSSSDVSKSSNSTSLNISTPFNNHSTLLTSKNSTHSSSSSSNNSILLNKSNPFPSESSSSTAPINLSWKDASKSKRIERNFISVSCLNQLASFEWRDEPSAGTYGNRSWQWPSSTLSQCHFKKFDALQARKRMRGAWIVVMGDSEARSFHRYFLRYILPGVEFHFKEETNASYQTYIPSHDLYIDFVSNRFPNIVTENLAKFKEHNACPDAIIFSVTLWHMLWTTNNKIFEKDLKELRSALEDLPCGKRRSAERRLGSVRGYPGAQVREECQSRRLLGLVQEPTLGNQLYSDYVQRNESSIFDNLKVREGYRGDGLLYWINTPALIPAKFNTEKKRESFSALNIKKYDQTMVESGLYYPEGPCLLLDLGSVSGGCGEECTWDGIHYYNATFTAMIQIMLNSFAHFKIDDVVNN